MTQLLFLPAHFLGGTASASHQVEGDNSNNQWWAFEQQPGAVWHGTAAPACDWWRNAEADFSTAWLGWDSTPTGSVWSERTSRSRAALTTRPSTATGDAGRSAPSGMTPLVTLHHFTEPLWFTRMGGWENGASVAFFRRAMWTLPPALGRSVRLLGNHQRAAGVDRPGLVSGTGRPARAISSGNGG